MTTDIRRVDRRELTALDPRGRRCEVCDQAPSRHAWMDLDLNGFATACSRPTPGPATADTAATPKTKPWTLPRWLRRTCPHTEFDRHSWNRHRRCGKPRGHALGHGDYTPVTLGHILGQAARLNARTRRADQRAARQ